MLSTPAGGVGDGDEALDDLLGSLAEAQRVGDFLGA
jgi:hypothetical protein